MVQEDRLIARHAESLVIEALEDTRVVLINGARQAGKSTLTRLAAGRTRNVATRLLDDTTTLAVLPGRDLAGPDRFIDAAFAHGPRINHSSTLRRRDYLERLVAGGFPEAVRRTPRRRAAFFDAYLSTLIQRDVLKIAHIERHGELLKLLALLAGRAGTLLVPGTLAGQSGIPRTTLVRYLELLASVFLIKSIPAWSSGQTTRAIGAPKLTFVDTGIACHLIGQDLSRLESPGGASGQMMENFVLMELARQLSWSNERGRLYHYRTRDNREVDAVIETPDGRIVGVEVKAGATVRTEDLNGLRNLAGLAGDRFVAGYVLYTGQQTLPFGDRIRAVPLGALWQLAP